MQAGDDPQREIPFPRVQKLKPDPALVRFRTNKHEAGDIISSHDAG